MAFRRRKMSRSKSRKSFRRHAGSHPRNTASPMRGGIRI